MMVMATLGEVNGRFLPAEEAGYQLGLPVDTRVLTYCIPFYAALHFATPMPGSWERFARALLVLWVLVILGLVSTTLKNFMLTFGERLLSLPQSPPADVIALAYQFNTLIVPPLAPILLWGLAVRETPVMRSLFPAALTHSSSSKRNERTIRSESFLVSRRHQRRDKRRGRSATDGDHRRRCSGSPGYNHGRAERRYFYCQAALPMPPARFFRSNAWNSSPRSSSTACSAFSIRCRAWPV